MSWILGDSSVAEPREVDLHWWMRSGNTVIDRGMWDMPKPLEKLIQDVMQNKYSGL